MKHQIGCMAFIGPQWFLRCWRLSILFTMKKGKGGGHCNTTNFTMGLRQIYSLDYFPIKKNYFSQILKYVTLSQQWCYQPAVALTAVPPISIEGSSQINDSHYTLWRKTLCSKSLKTKSPAISRSSQMVIAPSLRSANHFPQQE